MFLNSQTAKLWQSKETLSGTIAVRLPTPGGSGGSTQPRSPWGLLGAIRMGPDGGITVDRGSDGHGHREGTESPGKSRLMKSYEDLNMLLPLLPVRLQCVLQLPLEISAKKCCT